MSRRFLILIALLMAAILVSGCCCCCNTDRGLYEPANKYIRPSPTPHKVIIVPAKNVTNTTMPADAGSMP